MDKSEIIIAWFLKPQIRTTVSGSFVLWFLGTLVAESYDRGKVEEAAARLAAGMLRQAS